MKYNPFISWKTQKILEKIFMFLYKKESLTKKTSFFVPRSKSDRRHNFKLTYSMVEYEFHFVLQK